MVKMLQSMWFSDAGGVVCPSPCTFLVVTATRVEAIEGRAWDAGKNHLMNRSIAHNNELASANATVPGWRSLSVLDHYKSERSDGRCKYMRTLALNGGRNM